MKKIFVAMMVLAMVFCSVNAFAQSNEEYANAKREQYQKEFKAAIDNFDNAVLGLYKVHQEWGKFQDGGEYDMVVDPEAANQTECEAITGAIWVADPGLCKGLIEVGILSGMNELHLQNAYGSVDNFLSSWWTTHMGNFQNLP